MFEVKVYSNYDKVLKGEPPYFANFDSAEEAGQFCKEEVKWESCKRVVCKQLGIDVKGDFAS